MKIDGTGLPGAEANKLYDDFLYFDGQYQYFKEGSGPAGSETARVMRAHRDAVLKKLRHIVPSLDARILEGDDDVSQVLTESQPNTR
jgi:hypothetical protein